MRIEKIEEKAIALSKRIGWPVLISLVFWDAFVTFIRGREGNPLWKPIVETLGLNSLWFLAAAVIVLFYFVTKAVGWYVKNYERFPHGEEVVLTSLVIAFATYDLYITFLLPYYGFLGSQSHYYVIPVLIIPVLVYNLWLEYERRKGRIKLIKR